MIAIKEHELSLQVQKSLKLAKIKVKKEDYRFGIVRGHFVKSGTNQHRNLCVCNCGQHLLYPTNGTNFQCDNCGNDYFVRVSNFNSRPRFTIPYLESYRRDDRGFKVKRTNLSVIYTGYEVIPVQENMTRVMEYDMVERVLKVWKDGELEFDLATSNGVRNNFVSDLNSKFLTNLDFDNFIEFVSTDVNRTLYDVVKTIGYTGNMKRNLFRGLYDLTSKENQYLHVLANAGIPDVNRFRVTSRSSGINIEATRPHEILKVPRYFLSYIREDLSIARYDLQKFQTALKRVDAGKFKEIMSIVKDEGTMSELSRCIDTILEIHINHAEYSNLKKLTLYLFREVKMYQGFNSAHDAVTYLRDYIRMSKELGVEFEKYPRSLKKDHDLVTRNYNLIVKGRTNMASFREAINLNTYQELSYVKRDSKYAIVIPADPDDLVKEGNVLSHCIASYVKDIVSGKCKIAFLRNVDDLSKPLVSIEIRGFNIRQAKGRSNRSVTQEEKEFIKEWAKKKKLIEAYY